MLSGAASRDRGKPIGTVWIVAHNDIRKLDREDERIIKPLAEFVSAVYEQNASAAQ